MMLNGIVGRHTDGTNEANATAEGVDQSSVDTVLNLGQTKILRVVCLAKRNPLRNANVGGGETATLHTCISDFLRGCTAMMVGLGSIFFLPALLAGGYVSSVTFCAR
jgi:hypothetical protein